MSGYSKIASFYTHLFPLSDEAKGFLEPFVSRCRERSRSWLDVGCGTGNLLVWLLDRGVNAFGIEPDPDFADEARKRIPGQADRVIEAHMGELGKMESGTRYGVISCLGNVLPHVASLEEVQSFFGDAGAILADDGAAIVQIVNYDKVLATTDWQFPVLRRVAPDGTELVFHRAYEIAPNQRGGLIKFETVLRAGEETFRNCVWLCPIRKDSLLDAARPCFESLEVFGDFKGNHWSPESAATILVAEKPVRS